MRIIITDTKECCGCTACENICAHNAITMLADQLGFIYPHVDDDKCVDCGLCVKICQFKEGYNRWDNYTEASVYAIRNKSLEILSKSQSGAAFFTFSEYCLEHNYILYGAVLDNTFKVKHKRATTEEERNEMLCSKYVQSDIKGIFQQVKADLKNGEKVLFSGTPCQVAGLRSFLGEKLQQSLITIDLVCHGVPSPAIWESYIEWIERKYKSKVKVAKFRDKQYGWATHYETFLLKNGSFLKKNIFRDLFYNHYIVRESCSNCQYTNLNRVGDLSIGDFWGWQNVSIEWNDNKGVSLLLVNSDKGRVLFDACKDKLLTIPSNLQDCLQPQLQAPISLNSRYNKFAIDFTTEGFAYAAKKYGNIGWFYKCKQAIYFFKICLYKIYKIIFNNSIKK